MSVKIELIFDTVIEARDFLNKGLMQAPSQQLPQQGPAVVNSMNSQIAQAATAQTTPVAAQDPINPIKALREAAASLIARMPAGEGPKKVRELLMAQGIAKFADANPQQAIALAAQMNAA